MSSYVMLFILIHLQLFSSKATIRTKPILSVWVYNIFSMQTAY